MDKTKDQCAYLSEAQLAKIITLLEEIRSGIESLADTQFAKEALIEQQFNLPFSEDRYDLDEQEDSVPF
jgi:hypothetical protein